MSAEGPESRAGHANQLGFYWFCSVSAVINTHIQKACLFLFQLVFICDPPVGLVSAQPTAEINE